MASTFFVILFYLLYSVNCTSCSNYKECTGQVIDNNAHCDGLSACSEAIIDTRESIDCNGQIACYKSQRLSSEKRILCQGYKSCRYSQSIIAKGNIECNGWTSCDHGKEANYEFISDSNIQCSGSSSCQFNTMKSNKNTICDGSAACYQSVIISGDNIYCDGGKSCAKSKLVATNNIYCTGNGGCSQSKITGKILNSHGMYAAHKCVISSNIINGFGYYSISEAVIDSKGINTMDVNSFGEMSGFGAKVICRKHSQCTINCKGTGCYGLSFVCLNGAKCNVLPLFCENNINNSLSDNCPNIIQTDNDEVLVEDMVYFVDGNAVKMMTANSMIYIHLLSAFIVFVFTVVMVDCYFRRKYGSI